MAKKKTTENVFNYIVSYSEANGYSPSFREIAEELNIKSPSTIFYHINKLTDSGLIKKSNFKNRTLAATNRQKSVTDESQKPSTNEYVDVPLVGRVAAGMPILAEENIVDTLSLPSTLFSSGKSLFSLEVKGDSMINVGINDGDLIVVKRQEDAENGEIVVAMLDDESTVKRFYREKSCIRLQPENDNYSPIFADNIIILGKVIGLIRKI